MKLPGFPWIVQKHSAFLPYGRGKLGETKLPEGADRSPPHPEICETKLPEGADRSPPHPVIFETKLPEGAERSPPHPEICETNYQRALIGHLHTLKH